MSWIKNLKILNKMLLLSFITIVGLLILGFAGYTEIKNLGDSLDNMYEQKLVPIETVSQIKTNSQDVQRALVELMVSTDNAQNNKLLDEMKEKMGEIAELVGDYKTDNPDELEILNQLDQLGKQFISIQDKTIQLALDNKKTESYNEYVNETGPILDKMDELFTELIVVNSSEANDVNKENKKDVHRSSFIIVSLIVACIVFYLIVSWMIMKPIINPLKDIEVLMKKAQTGDLNVTSSYRSKDEIGSLSYSFNEMVTQLRELIKSVKDSSTHVKATSEQFLVSSDEITKASEHIADSTTQVATSAEISVSGTSAVAVAMKEMATGISDIAASISLVSEHSKSTTSESEKGNISLSKTIHQMNSINDTVQSTSTIIKELGSRSTEIEGIIGVISGISAQTNLLALNAAIEAARAGDQGKGFAVVADEVRKLAEESRRSAEQIVQLTQDIQRSTKLAVDSMEESMGEVKKGILLVNETGESFSKILHSTKDVSRQSEEVAAATEEVSASVEQIATDIDNISIQAKNSASLSQGVASGTEEQLASMQEITTSAHSLVSMADNLETLVSKFKI